ncbi:MAG TPA: dTDP-4-dehydrorhamnose 3,5-epimerase [Candidatus Methylomirabilis sp.]
MIFRPLAVGGAYLIEPERVADERGFFARTWCAREFAARGIHAVWVQGGVSFNPKAGTLRGMHYQMAPHAEAKLVRCARGAIYDVVVDLRRESPSFLTWAAVELTAENGLSLYVPEGVAHGFQTLAEDTEVAYQLSAYHAPEAARGVRWDDPRLGIAWPPCRERIISARDRSYPDIEACGASS